MRSLYCISSSNRTGAWFAFRPERLSLTRESTSSSNGDAANNATTNSRQTISQWRPRYEVPQHFQLADGKRTLRLTDFEPRWSDVHGLPRSGSDAKDSDTVEERRLSSWVLKRKHWRPNYRRPANTDLDKYRALPIGETLCGHLAMRP